MESLKIAVSKILSNSWKQELNITENGVESEIFRTGTHEKKNLQYEKIAEVIIRNGAFAATLEIVKIYSQFRRPFSPGMACRRA